jgi:hypothetical protein
MFQQCSLRSLDSGEAAFNLDAAEGHETAFQWKWGLYVNDQKPVRVRVLKLNFVYLFGSSLSLRRLVLRGGSGGGTTLVLHP